MLQTLRQLFRPSRARFVKLILVLWLVLVLATNFYIPVGFITNQAIFTMLITQYFRALEARDAKQAYPYLLSVDEGGTATLANLEGFLTFVHFHFDQLKVTQIGCLPISLCQALRVTAAIHYTGGQTQTINVFLRKSHGQWKIVNVFFVPAP